MQKIKKRSIDSTICWIDQHFGICLLIVAIAAFLFLCGTETGRSFLEKASVQLAYGDEYEEYTIYSSTGEELEHFDHPVRVRTQISAVRVLDDDTLYVYTIIDDMVSKTIKHLN